MGEYVFPCFLVGRRAARLGSRVTSGGDMAASSWKHTACLRRGASARWPAVSEFFAIPRVSALSK